MDPDNFSDKVNAASILHNLGVINRRTGKYNEAIQSYEDCLDLYNECLVYYNSLVANCSSIQNGAVSSPLLTSPSPSRSSRSPSPTNTQPICLELKIAQTLQSMARLYSKSLNDTHSAIKAHEDAITLLVEGKFLQDDEAEVIEAYWRQRNGHGNGYGYGHGHKNGYGHCVVYDSPKRHERISRHQNLYNEYNNEYGTTSSSSGSESGNSCNNPPIAGPSPTSVANHTLPGNSSTSTYTYTYNPSDYNIVKLTQHERVRVITISINALAKIYVMQEIIQKKEEENRNKRQNDNQDNDHDGDNDDNSNSNNSGNDQQIEDDNNDHHHHHHHNHNNHPKNQEEESRIIEDPLRYYQEAINFLRQIPNHTAYTSIPALSNNAKMISTANDASLNSISFLGGSGTSSTTTTSPTTAPTTSSSFTIDLRRDIGSTLMQMGALYVERYDYKCAIEAFEEARDIRFDICHDGNNGTNGDRNGNGNGDNNHDHDGDSFVYGDNEMSNEYVESWYALGLTYEKCKDFDKAMPCFQQVLKIKKRTSGHETVDVANLYSNMSNVLRQTGNLAESLSLNKRSIAIYRRNTGAGGSTGGNGSGDTINKCIVGALKNQGALYMQMEEVEMAIGSYEEVMKMQQNMGFENHPEFASTLNVLGDLYLTNRDLEKAKSSFFHALKLFREFGIGDNDPDLIITLKSINEIEMVMKRKTSPRKKRGKQLKSAMKANSPPNIKRGKSSKSGGSPIANMKSQSRSITVDETHYDNKDFAISAISPAEGIDDDLVSNLTFLTKKGESQRSIDMKEPCSEVGETCVNSWDAADYFHEGVLTMSKAINSLAAVTEDFLSGGIPNENMVENTVSGTKPVFLLSSDFGTEAGDVSTIFENLNSDDDDNDDEPSKANKKLENIDDGDLSSLLGSYTSRNPSNISISGTEDASTILGTAFLGNSSNSILTYQDEGEDSSTLFGSMLGKELQSIKEDTTGQSFVNTVSTATNSQAVKEDAASLLGTSFVNSVMTMPKKDASKSTKTLDTLDTMDIVAKCQDMNVPCQNMDDLLAQMNVVTNSMDEEDTAKPFKEILQVETGSDFEGSPDYSLNRRKNFEKLSNCLDTLEELEEQYGNGHVKCLDTLKTLSNIYFNNGDTKKGISTLLKVADVQSRRFGENHIEVASTHTRIGGLWCSQKDYNKAIQSYLRVKDIEDFLFGNTDPRVALTLNKIGLAELARGDFDMAMNYLQEALRVQRINLAPNEINPDVSQTLVNIGSVYYKERNSFDKIQRGHDNYKSFIESGMLGKIAFAHSERGEYVLATHFYEELLQLLKNRGRSQHGTIATLNNLGTLSVKLGRYVEAMSYHEQALELMQTLPDTKKIDICDIDCKIGIVEYLSGNFAKGTEVFENAMITQKELLGEDHPRLAASIFNLGMIKRILHKHEEAMSHFQIALQIQFLSIQKHHPDTMNTQMEIGITKLEMSKIDEAMEEFKSLLQTQVEILGHIHPDVALTHHYMGICHFKNNDIQKASKKLDRSFRIRQKLKMDCPKVANLLEDMGLLHMRKGRLDKAFNALMDSLRIRRDCLGEDHYELSYSAFNLGRLSFEKRDFAQALLYFKEAMRIALRSFGLHHPLIGDIHLYVGHVQQRRCHFHEAKSEIALAIQIYESANLSSSHKKIMDAKNDLLQVEREEELCV